MLSLMGGVVQLLNTVPRWLLGYIISGRHWPVSEFIHVERLSVRRIHLKASRWSVWQRYYLKVNHVWTVHSLSPLLVSFKCFRCSFPCTVCSPQSISCSLRQARNLFISAEMMAINTCYWHASAAQSPRSGVGYYIAGDLFYRGHIVAGLRFYYGSYYPWAHAISLFGFQNDAGKFFDFADVQHVFSAPACSSSNEGETLIFQVLCWFRWSCS